MNETRRLFFALWPDDKARQQLRSLTKEYVPKDAKPITRENLHATLIFLGNQPESALPDIFKAPKKVRVKPFKLILDHLEVWKRGQVLCLCASDIPDHLLELHDTLKRKLAKRGIETEKRAYRPHVTLGRKITKRLPQPDISPVKWNVKEFVLVESEIDQRGATYKVVKRYPLK